MKIPDAPVVELKIDGKARKFDLDNPKLPDWIKNKAFSSDGYPYDKKLKWKKYEEELRRLHIELVKVQYWLQDSGNRVMAVFEGRDAAGKGGSINAVRQNLNPRVIRTVALSKPSDTEQGQWYFQRYVSRFPTSGEMVLFDRSWYNRAGVEPVLGFCTPLQHIKFLDEVPLFEKMISDDGIYFFKFWLTIGHEMQLKRFHARRHDPVKVWKLSPIDINALQKWDDYAAARDLMFKKSHSGYGQWTIVRSNDKRRARINVIQSILNGLPYDGKDKKNIGKIDGKVISCPATNKKTASKP